MRLNISAWSIRRPVPAIVLFAVLTLLGVISFMTLPVTRFPNIDIPLISITVVQSGAAPADPTSVAHPPGRRVAVLKPRQALSLKFSAPPPARAARTASKSSLAAPNRSAPSAKQGGPPPPRLRRQAPE